MKLALGGFLLLVAIRGSAQESPVDIPRNELPKSAHCIVCEASGSAHGEEKPAAGVRFRGKEFYFCTSKEVAAFKRDPLSFMPPVLPRTAPLFRLKNLAREEIQIGDLKGRVVLVDFWATWCAPCVATMPEMQKLHVKYESKGLAVLGVSIDEDGEKKVKPFIARRNFTYPILLDAGQTWKDYGVKAIPALFLVDRSGRIVRQWSGKPDRKEVEKAVLEMLAEQRS